MLEDKWLVWKLQMGSDEALQQIYEKYKGDLLALALALAPDRATAEDALHDAFVAFAEFAPRLQLRGCLKSYLCSCVANHLRNRGKAKPQHTVGLEQAPLVAAPQDRPDQSAVAAEESQRLGQALEQLPNLQREVIILHLQEGLRFKAIAQAQEVSINTVQSRYRYGLEKLRSLLNGKVES